MLVINDMCDFDQDVISKLLISNSLDLNVKTILVFYPFISRMNCSGYINIKLKVSDVNIKKKC